MNPVKFGIYGGLAFALVSTIFHYIITKELSFSGVVGGLAWFITVIVINLKRK